MKTTMSRRQMLKLGGMTAAGALGASMIAGCAASQRTEMADTSASEGSLNFLTPPAPITDFAETKEYDVVVVGAGEAGLSAVHTALESGARVACVQNMESAKTTGNMAASLDTSQTEEGAIQACISFINWKSDYRSDRRLVDLWARNSFEAIGWWEGAAAAGGVESRPHDSVLRYNGYDIHLHANTYFHVDGAHGAAALVIADALAEQGAEFFYNTPAVQLYQEGDAVKGVICTDAEGNNILFKAVKGVILATGDYSYNDEMLDYYAPDTKGFIRMMPYRDGSGLCMGMWAGAVMTPVNHTKMIHGEYAPCRLEMPFLFLDYKGRRFCDEGVARMGYMNNFARKQLGEELFTDPTAVSYFAIVPSTWKDYYPAWKEKAPYNTSISNGGKEVNPEEWLAAASYEELAEKMIAYAKEKEWGTLPDAATIVESIKHYNEVCATGSDTDFGKDPDYLVPIDTETIYAVPRGSNVLPAILGGLVVDDHQQCLNANLTPIEGLFAVGNASGQFFGGVDYPMDIEGLSIGRAITSGYVTGKYVAER